jgi:hypothetical protein
MQLAGKGLRWPLGMQPLITSLASGCITPASSHMCRQAAQQLFWPNVPA